MDTEKDGARMRIDTPVDVKIKLSGLWTVLMFLYTYGDILGFYTPGRRPS